MTCPTTGGFQGTAKQPGARPQNIKLAFAAQVRNNNGMPFASGPHQVKISLAIPKTVHTAAKMEAFRTGQSLSSLLVSVLVGDAEPPRHKAVVGSNGAEPVRPSIALSAESLGKAVNLALREGISPTVLMSRMITEHFTRRAK